MKDRFYYYHFHILICCLSLNIVMNASAQSLEFPDPHESVDEALVEVLADRELNLEAIRAALDLDQAPLILEIKSITRSDQNNWAVNILSEQAANIGSGTVKLEIGVELTDGLSELRRQRTEESDLYIAFENSLTIGELKYKGKTTNILGELTTHHLSDGGIQRTISLITGAKEVSELVQDAYDIKQSLIEASDIFFTPVQSTINSSPIEYLVTPEFEAPLFYKASYFGYMADRGFIRQTSGPQFLRVGVYDPVMYELCVANCIIATNNLIASYNNAEAAWGNTLEINAYQGAVACAFLKNMGGPFIFTCLIGDWIGLSIAKSVVYSYYQPLRIAANKGCILCDAQCLELYLDDGGNA